MSSIQAQRHLWSEPREEGWWLYIQPFVRDHPPDGDALHLMSRNLIPESINQYPCAHLRRPIDIIFHG